MLIFPCTNTWCISVGGSDWKEKNRWRSPFSINKINYIQYWTFGSIFFWLHHISHMSIKGTLLFLRLFLINTGKMSRRNFLEDCALRKKKESTWRSIHFDFLCNIFSFLRFISHSNKKKAQELFFSLDSSTLSCFIILEHGYLDLSFSIW